MRAVAAPRARLPRAARAGRRFPTSRLSSIAGAAANGADASPEFRGVPVKKHEPEGARYGKSSQGREDGHAGFSADGCSHGDQEQADERRKSGEQGLVGHRSETQAQVSQRGEERDLRHRRLAGQNSRPPSYKNGKTNITSSTTIVAGIGRRLPPAAIVARRGTPSPRPPPCVRRHSRQNEAGRQSQCHQSLLARLDQRLFQRRGGEYRHDEGRPVEPCVFAAISGQGQLPFQPGSGRRGTYSGPSITIQGTTGTGAGCPPDSPQPNLRP